MLLIALEYLICASTFTLAKQVLSYCPYLFLLTARFFIGAFFLLGFMHYLGKVSWKAVWHDRWLFLLVGFLHIYCAFVLEFWALQYLTSAKTSLIYAMSPFWAALLSYILHKERLSATQWCGLIVATSGLLPLFLVHNSDVGGLTNLFLFSLPDFVLCGAVFSAAAAWFGVKKLMDRGHHLVVVNGMAMAIGSVLCCITMLILDFGAWNRVLDWPSFLVWLSILIFLSQVVSYNFYSWLLTRYSITFMTLCGFLCPFFSGCLGAFFLGEIITWHFIVSFMAVSCGLFIFTRPKKIIAG
jgi:drug/metabolite transporter (DMT)-like permease